MKKVMLLGDSIRRGYEPRVRNKLSGEAETKGPDENCRFAKYTLWYAETWIDQLGQPDIIHWNNGLWDLYLVPGEHAVFTPLEEYLTTLKRILAILRRTGATIIWATTTPVHPDNQFRNNADIDRYNAAVVEWMISEKIAINDLNRVIKQNISAFISEDRIHLTAEGSEACAEAVAGAVRPLL